MKKTDTLVNILDADIKQKDLLEVACGAADFSISAARIADSVSCIDLDDSRLNDFGEQKNIYFQIMDASKMLYSDDTFDTIVIYNAFFHIQPKWDMIERECRRVVKRTGKIYIVGTWSLDINPMKETFKDSVIWRDGFLIVEIEKQ